jgi:O-antigen/teichoic acid export membrane protein
MFRNRTDILTRAYRGIAFAGGANALVILLVTLRSIALARWLPIEVFGAYALASALVEVTRTFAGFGLGGALFHRGAATGTGAASANVHFTLTLLLTMAWAALLAGFGMVALDGRTRVALLTLVLARGLSLLTSSARILLQLKIEHARLAGMRIAGAAASTAVALSLALDGQTLSAVLSIDLVNAAVAIALLHLWRPGWTPKLTFDRDGMGEMLSFGARNLLAQMLASGLRRADKLLAGWLLGTPALGLYARAFSIAAVPGTAVSRSFSQVSVGVYAAQLSSADELRTSVTDMMSLQIRGNMLLCTLMAILAQPVVTLLIGVKWLPMLPALYWLLAATALAPLVTQLTQLLLLAGRPEGVARLYAIQLVCLCAASVPLALVFGIVGVSAAVLLATAVALVLGRLSAAVLVEIDAVKVFAAPVAAGAFAGSASLFLLATLPGSLWSAAASALLFTSIYVAMLGLLEGQDLRRWLHEARAAFTTQANPVPLLDRRSLDR